MLIIKVVFVISLFLRNDNNDNLLILSGPHARRVGRWLPLLSFVAGDVVCVAHGVVVVVIAENRSPRSYYLIRRMSVHRWIVFAHVPWPSMKGHSSFVRRGAGKWRKKILTASQKCSYEVKAAQSMNNFIWLV